MISKALLPQYEDTSAARQGATRNVSLRAKPQRRSVLTLSFDPHPRTGSRIAVVPSVPGNNLVPLGLVGIAVQRDQAPGPNRKLVLRKLDPHAATQSAAT